MNILGNLLTPVVVLLIGAAVGGVYSLVTSNPQAVLLVAFIVLSAFNSFAVVVLYRRQTLMMSTLQRFLGRYQPTKVDSEPPYDLEMHDIFQIKDKYFDEASLPQKLVIQYVNRGDKQVHVEKVRFSTVGSLGLSDSALTSSYAKDGGNFVLPIDKNSVVVAPGEDFRIEIELAQAWKREDMNRMAGHWGYLKLDVIYSGKPKRLFDSI